MPITAEQAQVEIRRRSAVAELQRREGLQFTTAFPIRDPNKPIDFIEDIIPPVDTPRIADPKDVSAPVFKPAAPAIPTRLEATKKGFPRRLPMPPGFEFASPIEKFSLMIMGSRLNRLLERFGKQLANSFSRIGETIISHPLSPIGISQREAKLHRDQARQELEESGFSGSAAESEQLVRTRAAEIAASKRVPKFGVEPSEDLQEKVTDVAAGLTAFISQLAIIKRILPAGTPAPVVWEAQNALSGGLPGEGAAMRLTLGQIGKIPTGTLAGKLGKVGLESGVFAGYTAATGGNAEDIIIAGLIPVAFNAWSFAQQSRHIKSYEKNLRQLAQSKHQQRLILGMNPGASAAHLAADMRIVDNAIAKAKQSIYHDDAFAPAREKWEAKRQEALNLIKSGTKSNVQKGNRILNFVESAKLTVGETRLEIPSTVQQATRRPVIVGVKPTQQVPPSAVTPKPIVPGQVTPTPTIPPSPAQIVFPSISQPAEESLASQREEAPPNIDPQEVEAPPTEAIEAPEVPPTPITESDAKIVRPKLHIGNITARMRKVAAAEFGVEPEEIGPFLEGAFPTKKAPIPMTTEEAENALTFIEQSLDERLENNLIRTENDLTQANIDWADIKALRIVLGKPVGARPFRVTRAEKPQVAIIDTEKKLADQTVPALKEIAEVLELDTKGTKAEIIARIESMASELETTAESIIRLAKEEVSGQAVTVLRTTKEVIQAAIKPSSIMDAGLSADKVLQVVMKKAEVVSAKAWLESARDIVAAHKDLATYIKGRMKGIGLSTAEQNRLLQMVAKGRTPTEKAKIAAAVEMLVHRAEIRQANKNLEKAIKKFKKKVGKTVWKDGLWPNAQQKIENLLSAITTKKITEKNLNDARSLRNYLERAKEQIENEFDADLAESLIPNSRLKLLDTVTRDQTRLLTPQGIEAITQEIERVINLNDVKSKWFVFGKKNRAKALLDNVVDEIRAGKTRRSAEKESAQYEVRRGVFKKAKDIGIGLNNDDLYTLAKRIVGKEGYLNDVADTDIRKGTDKVYEVLQTALRLFNEKVAAKGVTAKDLKRMSSEFDTWTPSAFFKKLLTTTSKVNIKGKKIKLTQGQLIDIYLYAQQEQSLDYMLKNPQNYFNNINVGKLTTQELSDVLSKLSPKARIVADAMSEVLNTYVKGELADTQLRLDGINIFTIPNHWHIEHPREGRISGHQTYVSEKIELQDFMRPRVGSRTGIVNRDAFVRFRKVLSGSAEYIGYAEPLRSLRMVLNNSNVTDAIKSQGYRAELDAIKTIIKRAQDTSPLIDDLSNLSSKMLRGFIRSALALKVDIGAMQATSSALYLNFIEAKYLTPLTVRGFFTRSELKEAIEHSPFLWARWILGHQSMEVGYLAQTDATLRLFMGKSHKANWTMKHLQVGDMIAMLNGWRIAKKYVKNTTKHKVGSQEYWDTVNKKANYLWYRTQPIFDKFGRSVNTSTPGLARHAFIFRSFRQKALQNIHNSGKFNNKAMSIAIVLTTLAMGELIKAMIRWPLFGDEPEPKELAKKLVTSPLSLLAVVGYPAQSIVSNMIDRALGDKPRWSEVELSLPIFGMINKSLQSVNYTFQAIGFQLSGDSEKAEDYGFRAIRNMVEALATYFGAPVSFYRAFKKKPTKKTVTKKPVFKRRGASARGKKSVFKKRTK